MKRKLNIVESVMHYWRIMLLVVVALIGFGVYSLWVMPKNEFPTTTIRQGVMVAVYPGATAEDVETQVAKPLERFLWGFKEIKKKDTYTKSKDGVCYVYITLNDNIIDKDEFWSKFKIRAQQEKANLPQGVLAIIVNDDFGDTSAMLITLESDTKTYSQLHDIMTNLEDSLRTIPELSNLRVYGEQKEQIGIYVDRDKLSAYGINTATLLAQLHSQGMKVMSGSVDDGKTIRPIHITSPLHTENDVANQIVYSDPSGNVIRLRDIATVKREYPDPSSCIKNNGKKCLVLSIEMNEGNDIVAFGGKVKQILERFEKHLPADVNVFTITDQSQVVGDSVIHFLGELVLAIVTVVIVIILLLPLRVAAVAASTIPVTILISIGLFYAFGIEINTVTLAALIVTLGMIVDNSIVIVDSYVEYIDMGMSRWHAAARSSREFAKSIFSATLAISITFFPLMATLTGMYHDFVVWFPKSMSIVLGTSLVVALLLVPYLQYVIVKKGLKKDANSKKTLLDYVQGYYDKAITKCFAHPYATLSVGLVSIVLGVVWLAHLPQQLMPRAERNQFAVEIYMPEGTALEQTAAVADSLRDIMKKDERVKNITTFYGSGSPRFQTAYAPQLGGSNFAQFIVNTENDDATQALLDDYTDKYAHYFKEAKVRFKQLEYNDATVPVEVRVQGENLADLNETADTIMKLMRKDGDFRLVRSSSDGTLPAINVALDADEASRLGISATTMSLNLATRFGDGIPLTSVWENDDEINIVLKEHTSGSQSIDELENANVSGMLPGMNVPMRQTASLKPVWQTATITRYNGVRTVAIMSDIARGVNMNKAIDKAIKIYESVPHKKGVSINIAGQREKDKAVEPQIAVGLVIAVVIIFVILLFHFRNINRALLIFLSLAFALPGMALGIGVMGQELSITSILGVISLMGIISRCGIIMVDYAEELRNKHHLTAKHAALEAAKRRMRPIFLTSAAASMGVISMVISNNPMWGPMGCTVFFGSIFTMFYIVTMIPVGYWLLARNTKSLKFKK